MIQPLDRFFEKFTFLSLISIMHANNQTYKMDEEILSLLSEIPKKKYLKKVIDVAINLNTDHNMFPSSYKNPITENLQKDLQISKEQTQRLLLALSKLIEVVCSYNFQIQLETVFSKEFDEQLGEFLLASIISKKEGIEEGRLGKMNEGSKMVDLNWRLDMQIGNEKGKKNEPLLIMQIESVKEGMMRSEKIGMKGEEFSAFYNNFKKIKEQLSQLVEL